MSKNKKKTCNHVVGLKKQLFKNKTVHLKRICVLCSWSSSKDVYAPKTKENLKSAIGWIQENDETRLFDELMGLGEKDILKEIKIDLPKKEENYVCGNCKNNCGKCKLNSDCPCHWP